MKYPQHILAVHNNFVNAYLNSADSLTSQSISGSLADRKFVIDADNVRDLNGYGFADSLEMFGVAVLRRQELESNVDYKQILPYCVVQEDKSRSTEHPYLNVLAYRRIGKNGEARLSGNVSIGFGGHVDIADCVYTDDSVIDVDATIQLCVRRELDEELIINVEGAHQFPLVRDHAIIVDDSNDVGKHHIGVVSTLSVPVGSTVSTEDEGIEIIGFMSTKEILDTYPNLENWSKMLCVRDVEMGENYLKNVTEL